MIQDPFGIFLALAASVFLAVWLERNYGFFRSLSAGLLCLVFGMILSNTGVLVGEAEAYRQISDIWINAAIVLVLLKVDLGALRSAGRAMLLAFGLGALGTMLGTFLGTVLLAGELGAEAWKLTGQFTGTYIGGSANFYALAGAFGTDPNLMSAALAADVIVTSVWLAACIAIPALLRGGRSVDSAPAGEGPLTLERQLNESGESLRMLDFFGLAALTLGTMVASRLIAAVVPGIPAVLWLTAMALLLGHTAPVRRLRGAPVLGNSLLYLFLAANGARSLISEMLAAGPTLLWFATIAVAVHGLVIFGVGRLCRLDAGTLSVASQANIGGAASAVAIASARGYADRLLPGIAVALAGYAVGNYFGFGMGIAARALLGG